MATQPVQPLQFPSPKKALIRRFAPDHSQRTRHIVQGLFLLLNGWLGLQFYLWTRYFERGGTGFSVSRPAGVEGWLPIAGLMNTKYFLLTGPVPADPSRRHVPLHRLHADEPPAEKGLLLLALPGWHVL